MSGPTRPLAEERGLGPAEDEDVRDTDLFQQALNLPWPWRVVRSEFDASVRQLDLYLDFETGGTFACPECGQEGCTAHDTSEKTWRHLDFFQHQAFVHARTPRVRCDRCGVKQVEVPWARPGSGFTLLFEALVLAMIKGMPVATVARLIGEHDTRIWRILHHYVDEARSAADFSDVRRVGVDETASKRGQNYITLFVDLDERRLLYATEGRRAATLGLFRQDLEQHGGRADQIEDFCLDMSAAFLKGIETWFPHAGVTFDKFHIMKLINDAVDEVRREEQKERPELKGSRYVWVKNPETLTRKQIAISDELHVPSLNLKTVRAYHMRLNFQDMWAVTAKRAERMLKQWCGWAARSRLEPMVRVARTIREHWDGVLRWFETFISNGILEGINSLIQAAKAKARGYRTTRNLITIAYLTAGKLALGQSPT
jgi:transposase